jgi:ribosome-binding protein aMBF1 (putative translation factor)
MEERKLSSDAFQWTYDRYIKDDPEREASFQDELLKAEIARQVYDSRRQSCLSRKQLADLVVVEESVIEDIEEADYEGDFLLMASRIANALHRRVEVRFVPLEGKESVEVPL